MRQPIAFQWYWLCGIKQQQLIQPSLDLISQGISDGISHAHLSESLEAIQLISSSALLPDFLKQLEGQRPTSPLISVDSAGKEEIVTTEECLDIGKGNGCCLVDNHQIGVSDLISIVGEDELDELGMTLEDINSQHCTIVILIVAEDTFEVNTLLEVQ